MLCGSFDRPRICRDTRWSKSRHGVAGKTAAQPVRYSSLPLVFRYRALVDPIDCAGFRFVPRPLE